ncbi:hypothetical protein [Lysinibacillus sp. FN11]|uniref:hypothetical protein n=1 Tax=Lysinibacillus sp. FN11 TaxID=2968499 RepID=UPI00214CB8C9|nr:hypothetical protein [Lysinibacillus sp. FN11]UUV25820.1 hypothetical protein NP781_04180 [Lysinibacillus sp. FN11]
MYWCKIAKTNEEFEAIARLNYETFVEEIPQHEVNASRKKLTDFIRRIPMSLFIIKQN